MASLQESSNRKARARSAAWRLGVGALLDTDVLAITAKGVWLAHAGECMSENIFREETRTARSLDEFVQVFVRRFDIRRRRNFCRHCRQREEQSADS